MSVQIRGLTRLDSISLAPSPASPASTAVGAATPAKMARYANAFLGGTFPSEAHTSPLPRRKQVTCNQRMILININIDINTVFAVAGTAETQVGRFIVGHSPDGPVQDDVVDVVDPIAYSRHP